MHARDLISKRVLLVHAKQRPQDVIGEIIATNASYCAVMEEPHERFLGIARLKDIADKSADRFFSDLIVQPPPLDIRESMESNLVAKIMEARGNAEVVVLSDNGDYVGVITRESYFEWRVAQKRQEFKKSFEAIIDRSTR
jgi:CBS domain-containing protein